MELELFKGPVSRGTTGMPSKCFETFAIAYRGLEVMFSVMPFLFHHLHIYQEGDRDGLPVVPLITDSLGCRGNLGLLSWTTFFRAEMYLKRYVHSSASSKFLHLDYFYLDFKPWLGVVC